MHIKSCFAGLLLATANLGAQATTVDFRTLAPGTSVTNQYADFTASLSGGNASGDPTIAYYTYGTGYDFGGLSNSPTSGYFPTAEYLNITFTSAVDALSFNFYTGAYNGANAWFTYDAGHRLLETGALTGFPLVTASKFGSHGISTISFSNGMDGLNQDWTQSLAVLNYHVASRSGDVPEPASLVLVGAGLAGLASLRRRRKPA
jgi:hypothetical protein